MSCPLRFEFAGALYRVMTRGKAREAITVIDATRASCCAGIWRE